MEIPYRGTITKQDFLKCAWILNSQLKWQRWFFGILFGTMALSLVYLWFEGSETSRETVQSILGGGPTMLIPLAILLYPWWLPYLSLTAYNQKPNIYRSEVFGTIGEQELTISNGEVRAAFQWSAYTGYKLNKDLFILRQGKYGFSAFKPSMFRSLQEWERFVSFAKDKIAPR
jgi:hypothetical protein